MPELHQDKPLWEEKLEGYESKIDELIEKLQKILVQLQNTSGKIDMNELAVLTERYTALYKAFIKNSFTPVINAVDEDIADGRIPEDKKEIAEQYIKKKLQAFNFSDFGQEGEKFVEGDMIVEKEVSGTTGIIVKCIRRGIKDHKGNVLSKGVAWVGSGNTTKDAEETTPLSHEDLGHLTAQIRNSLDQLKGRQLSQEDSERLRSLRRSI